MKHIAPIVGLISRLYLAGFFLAHVVQFKFSAPPEWLAKAFPAHFSVSMDWQDDAVALLLFIIALWLIAGIRSRIVGIFGFVLCSGNMILRNDVPFEILSPLSWSPDRMAAFAAVLMLALVGGGKWRLLPGGWSFGTAT